MKIRASNRGNRSELHDNREEALGPLPTLVIERHSNSILSLEAMIVAAHRGLQDACANHRDAQARREERSPQP